MPLWQMKLTHVVYIYDQSNKPILQVVYLSCGFLEYKHYGSVAVKCEKKFRFWNVRKKDLL